MPTAALTPCTAVGCFELVDSGRCARHSQQREQQRGSRHQRGYDGKWDRFRRAYINAHPLCSDCLTTGHTTPASEVHHIHKLRDGGDRLNPDNCMPLCKQCHSIRTSRGE